jgi:hypothetical protein
MPQFTPSTTIIQNLKMTTYIKKCSTLLIIREMKNKTERYLASIRTSTIKKMKS